MKTIPNYSVFLFFVNTNNIEKYVLYIYELKNCKFSTFVIELISSGYYNWKIHVISDIIISVILWSTVYLCIIYGKFLFYKFLLIIHLCYNCYLCETKLLVYISRLDCTHIDMEEVIPFLWFVFFVSNIRYWWIFIEHSKRLHTQYIRGAHKRKLCSNKN